MTGWKNPRANPLQPPPGVRRGTDVKGKMEPKPSAWNPQEVLDVIMGEGSEGAATGGVVDNILSPPSAGLGPLSVPLPHTRTGALYSHSTMVDLMIRHPDYSHKELAAHFGRPPGWISSVLASAAFQEVLEPRRHLVLDPSLTATIEERFRALAIQGVGVLQQQLDKPEVSDFVLVKVAEVSVKALGMGQLQPQVMMLPAPAEVAGQTVAEKLLAAMDARDRSRTIDVGIQDVTPKETSSGE